MAAPVFDAASHAQAAGVPSVTWSHTCSGTNRYLAVGASTDWADNIISVTYNGVACTKLTDASLGSGPIRAEYWYLINPASGAHDVVITFNSSTSGRCGAVSFTGAHQTTFHGTPNTATGTSSTASVVVTSSATDQIVLDVAAIRSVGDGITVGGGQTSRIDQETNPMDLGMSTEPGAASVTMSWTVDGGASRAWATIGVAIIGITAGSPGIVLPVPVEIDAEVGAPILANLGDFPPPPPGTAEIPTLIIQGIDRTENLMAVQRLDIEYTLGARGFARGELLDRDRVKTDLANAYRPVVDQTLALSRAGVTLFFGSIQTVDDSPLIAPNTGVVSSVAAADFQEVTSRRIMSATYAAGNLLKGIVNHIVTTWLSIYNITLDPAMLDGPGLSEQSFDLVTVEAALNHLSDITGWVWRITPNRVLEMFEPGTKVAPFSLTATNGQIKGGVRISKTRTKRVNRQYVRFGTEQQIEMHDTFFVTDPIQSFALTYPEKISDRGYITVNGIVVPIGPLTDWVITRTHLLAVNPPSPGDVIDWYYTVQFPIVINAADVDDINANGAHEDIANLEDTFDIFTATQYAQALLRKWKSIPRTLTIKTRAGLVLPGTVIPITIPDRLVSGNWLVTSVTIRDEADQQLAYEYHCLEGTEARSSWLEFWRQALGAPSQNKTMSGSVSGVALPPASGSFNQPISAVGGNDAWAANFIAGTQSGQSYGVRIQGGTTTADASLRVVNSDETLVLLLVRGDGSILASTQVTAGVGAGDIVLKNGADLRAVNAAGTGTFSMMEFNSSNQVVLSPEGEHIRWGRPAATVGGGATATLGTIGGSGPTSATQAGWRPVFDESGVLTFEPFWT